MDFFRLKKPKALLLAATASPELNSSESPSQLKLSLLGGWCSRTESSMVLEAAAVAAARRPPLPEDLKMKQGKIIISVQTRPWCKNPLLLLLLCISKDASGILIRSMRCFYSLIICWQKSWKLDHIENI